MKNHLDKRQQLTSSPKELIPQILVAVSYYDIFSKDDNKPTIGEVFKELPMMVVLTYVLKQHLSVHFSMYASEPHKRILDELCRDLYKVERTNLYRFRRRNNRAFLYHTESTLRMCFETLKYGYDLEEGDDQLQPTREEAINIAKAYTLCNTDWIESQKLEADTYQTMLMLDLPVSEFKFHKDVKAATYKASQFFLFCENDPTYKKYLAAFYQDYCVQNWRDYLGRLFMLFTQSINQVKIEVCNADVETINFYNHFVINIDDLRQIKGWESPEALLYLRNHFLFHVTGGIYYIISPDLIVDKIYQGLKFMFFETIKKHNLLQPDGKPYKEFPQFTHRLGMDFSEISLAYRLFDKALKGNVDCILSGEMLRQAGIKDGEPDLYIRKGDALILVEIKDLLFDSKKLSSGIVSDVHNYIFSRICKYPEKPHKGFGQILDNIDRLVSGGFNNVDASASDVKTIYPVIVTTDNAFSALGVNATIVTKATEIMQSLGDKFGKRFISIPIIFDIDVLVNLAYRLSKGELDLFNVLWEYITQCQGGTIPLKAYVHEQYLKSYNNSKDEILFLFGAIFPEDK